MINILSVDVEDWFQAEAQAVETSCETDRFAARILALSSAMSSATVAEETLPDVLEEWGQANILSIVPFDEDSDVEEGLLGELTVEALGDCDWAGFCR